MATERLAILLETVGTSQVVRQLEGVSGATKGLGDKASKASGMLGNLGVSGAAAGGMLSSAITAGVGAAGAALVTFGVNAVQTFTDIAQSALALQRASGATAEQASMILAAADDVGIGAEVVNKSVFQLGKRIEDNASKLEAHGIVVARDAKGNTDLAETLLNVADAYSKTVDPAKRAQLVADAFGKSGQQLIPLLERGPAGIRKLFEGAAATGQVLSQDDINRAEEYRLALDELHDSVQAVSIAAGQLLVPVLIKVAGALTQLVDAGRDVGNLPVIKQLIAGWAIGMGDFTKGNNAGAESLTGLDKAAADAALSLEEDEKTVDALTKAVLAVPSAQRALEQATRATAAADRNLTDARKDYNDLLKKGAVDEEKVAAARRSLNEATRSLGSSQRNLRERQEEYNEALANFQRFGGDTAFDRLQDAGDNLADATDGVASATERQTDASADLARAQAGDPEFNDKLAAAKQRVTDTEVGLADAQLTQSQRAFELNEKMTEQNTLLSENAGLVGGVRGEWEKLIALNPAIEKFLAAPLAALGSVGTAAPRGTSDSPGYLQQRGGPGPSTPAAAPSGVGQEARETLRTLGGVVINITEAVTNPVDLAKQILWHLN